MTRTIRKEIEIAVRNWPWVLGFFVLFGLLPYMNYYHWDGVYYNRVLTFGEGINHEAMVTDKDSYCPSEDVYTETNFCKNRDVVKYQNQWWLGNGHLTPVKQTSSGEPGALELPIGCYPSDSDAVILSYRFTIPENAQPGFHYGYGLTKHFLDLDRKPRLQVYRTVPFFIKTTEECK